MKTKTKTMTAKAPTSFPSFDLRSLYSPTEPLPTFSTAEAFLLPEELSAHVAALTSRSQETASTLLAGWLPEDNAALFLLQYCLTDETWAAARAVVEGHSDLRYAYLPFGVGMLGLAIVPRLVEAHATKKLAKHTKLLYRIAIIAALAAEAARGNQWPAAYDEYLRFDPEGLWLSKNPYLLGNPWFGYKLEDYVMPMLHAAIGALPAARAQKLLDEAMDTFLPTKFPMAYFALPCVKAHWKPAYLEKAAVALCMYTTHVVVDGNEPCKSLFLADARALGVFDDLMIEIYKTGQWKNEVRFYDPDASLKKAKRILPKAQYAKLAADL
ncbi:MAG: hypothetical protein SFX73_23305 [Kofleriaceae bacterium]|nr:hypothetical protein [Kofleriaceae bacterium]